MSQWPMKFMAAQFGIDLVDERNSQREQFNVTEHEASKKADAKALVREWNRRVTAGADTQFSPSIGCAVRAGTPWIRLYCPACQTIGNADLRRIVRDHSFPIEAIKFYCDSCRGAAPRPKLVGLFMSKDSAFYDVEYDPPADMQGDPPTKKRK